MMALYSAQPSSSGQPLAFNVASPSAWYSGDWSCGRVAALIVTGGKATSSSKVPLFVGSGFPVQREALVGGAARTPRRPRPILGIQRVEVRGSKPWLKCEIENELATVAARRIRLGIVVPL